MPFQLGGGGAGNMGGGGFDWGSLVSNPLVLQMMASMGASLDPEGPAGAIGGVTNQWIRSQSQMKMMQKLLGGGAKVTFDGKGNKFSITGEPSALGALDESNTQSLLRAQQGSQLPGGSGIDWNQQNMPSIARQVNPFVSSQSGVNLADLAGLQGEDINQAMQLLLGQRGIDRQSVADMYDAMYKAGLLGSYEQQSVDRQAKLRAEQEERQRELSERIPYKVDGVSAYLSPKEFVTISDKKNTTAWRNYLKTIDPNETPTGEGFKAYQEKMAALGGGLNLEDTIAKTTAVGKAKQEVKVTSPDYVPSVVKDLKKDFYSWEESLSPYREKWKSKGITGAEADRLAEKAYVLDEITKRLTIQYGEGNVKVDIVNDEIIWKVNGKVVQRY